MKVLALEPYYGGSHQAFMDGWRRHSRHDWTLLTLPATKWKWRMRHASITWAAELNGWATNGESWDVVICSDMLNLAEFRGLAPPSIQRLPSVVYFHENQLTYPVRHASERDYQYVFINLTTALAAERVWFNTRHHRDVFLAALPGFLRGMPDCPPLDAVERLKTKVEIVPSGIDVFPPRGGRMAGPLRILWSARWEHDKNPETFFTALQGLRQQGVDFRISVLGEQFRERPPVFDQARIDFADRIDRWGRPQSREAYVQALIEADVVVSTALHETFGMSMMESIAAGAYPMLPNRLCYPEIIESLGVPRPSEFLYDGSHLDLTVRLGRLAERLENGSLWPLDCADLARRAECYCWPNLAPRMDAALEGQPFEDTQAARVS